MAETVSSSRRLSSACPRFSIRSLLIAMAAVGALFPLGGYLLRTASTWTASMTVLATALLLAGALCLAVNRQGAARSFWAGCAIFGFTYFILAGDPWGSQPYNYELFTETLSIHVWAHYFSEPATPAPASSFLDGVFNGGFPELRDFVMVAHMFWSLAFGLVGGWVSLFMDWTGRRQIA